MGFAKGCAFSMYASTLGLRFSLGMCASEREEYQGAKDAGNRKFPAENMATAASQGRIA
jgi:hypothetical protein